MSFWKGVKAEVAPMLKKYLEPVRAEVVEISGSTARVAFPGEDPAAPQRPFYPVIGATPTVGQTVLVLANFAGGWIITSGGSGGGAVDSVDGRTGAVTLGDLYVNETDHTKAAHDALGIDAATLDGTDSTGFAPASHVGAGGTAHADATTSTAGFMSGADKALLNVLPQHVVLAAAFSNYNITIATNTWKRLNNGTINAPQITMPALGAAPTGYKWVVTARGFVRLIPSGAGGVIKINATINNGAMGAVHGDEAVTQDRLVPVLVTLDVPDPTASFTVDFGIFGPADTYLVAAAAKPEANCYLVRV